MRRYEMMVMITDTVEEDEATSVFEKVKSVLGDQGGTLHDENWWGKRKLAYQISKRDHGYYGVLDFECSNEGLLELERQLKISDNIVRFKTVRPDLRVLNNA